MSPLQVLDFHAGNLFGGVEQMVKTIASTATRIGWSFALSYRGRLSAELEEAGAPVTIVGRARLSRPWTVWAARRAASGLLNRIRPDIAVCHSDWSQQVFGRPIQHAGVPLVRWMHAPPTGAHWLERWAARWPPALVICNSRFTQAAVRTVLGEVDTGIVHPPVRRSALAGGQREALRAALNVPRDHTVLIQVSRMEPWKGQSVFLEALGQLKARSDWTAWFVGGAQQKEEERYLGMLGLQAVQLGLTDRVRFLGERRDVDALLGAADIFCQPNLGPEPFGIVFVEALYAGLPVVTSRIGAAPEIVDSSCGVLLPPGDPGALAEALARLMDDRPARQRLAAAGPARATSLCEPAQQVELLATLLTRVARRH